MKRAILMTLAIMASNASAEAILHIQFGEAEFTFVGESGTVDSSPPHGSVDLEGVVAEPTIEIPDTITHDGFELDDDRGLWTWRIHTKTGVEIADGLCVAHSDSAMPRDARAFTISLACRSIW